MGSRSHGQRQGLQKTAFTDVDAALPSRPFVVPTPAGSKTIPNVQAQLEAAQRLRRFSAIEPVTDSAAKLSSVPFIQPKLTIGAPGDKYEREADRVAQQVVQRLNAPKLEQSESEKSVQRESLPEEEDELQMKPLVQRASNGAIPASEELESAIAQSRGGGQPLADPLRQPLEQAFGADFSRVRVHADTQADRLNRSIQARAFTTGQDVFFRQGAYQPGNQEGQELIAHELTHVVQQNGNRIRRKESQKQDNLSTGSNISISSTQNNRVQRRFGFEN
ncbi:MAG: DUF4157 domain-containing protein [Acaryochloridaceae cyanobacterium RU_4_10]|nr:DUF4157 domain-containing protein [Acaryochloridaceae cyanobacterium RU_4_10]